MSRESETVYYDSVTGKPLFVAPRGRSVEEFLKESQVHCTVHVQCTCMCSTCNVHVQCM